ncbi:MlaD family protein [Pelagibius sp.]|uniref:MlaD family protein n=1 Tax=Pelagibius sp. TaxID=1931238 RepID=UPI00262ECC6B|nr:MlaD family protein [Pelagibius sp.]
MRHQGLNYALVGGFVIAMLVAAVAAMIALSGGAGPRDRYTIVFDNVADVKFGTQVRYEGFPVGQVEAIEPVAVDGAMAFHLDVSVQKGWVIPADSVARIHSSKFLAAKTVEITRGESPTSLSPGAQIASAPSADMFAAMADIAGEVGVLSREGLQPLLARLGELAVNANRLIDSDVAPLLGSLNTAAAGARGDVPAITNELRIFSERLNATLASVQALLSERNVAGINHTVENIETVSQNFVEITAAVQHTLGQLDGIVTDLQQVVESNEANVNDSLDDTRYILRSIAQNIDTINHNLAGTTRNMNEFSRLIRQNPGLLLGGSPPQEVNVETTAPSGPIRRDN